MIKCSAQERTHLKLKKQIQALAPSKTEQKKVVKKLGQGVRKQARKNIRKQKTVDGAKMKRRKGKRKAKMLRRIGKKLIVTTQASGRLAEVTYKSKITGKIAARQQHGIATHMTARKMSKIYARKDNNAQASRATAKALTQEGYKHAVKTAGGIKYKRVSQKFIRTHLTQARAGLILRMLRNVDSKKSWKIPLPARPFLGVNDVQAANMLDDIAQNMMKKIKKGS